MKRAAVICLLALLASCNATKIGTGSISDEAPVIVYKTRSNYDNNVPITLNDTKDKIISYPAPSDLHYEGELTLPVKLKRGYLLDRRGISSHAVFTSFTYEEYSNLGSPPSDQELLDRIIDKDPFEAIYYCGKRSEFVNLRKELNKMIVKGMNNIDSMIE